MKRLVVLTSAHTPFDNRIVQKQLRSLSKLPVKLFFVVPWNEKVNIDFAEVRCIKRGKGRFYRFFALPFQLFLKCARCRPDVIHFHDPDILLLAPLFKVFLRSQVVYDIHEDYASAFRTRDWIPKFFRKPVSCIYRKIEQLLLRFVDALVLAEDSYVNLYKDRKRYILVRNFSHFPPVRNDRRLQEAITSDFIYIGSIRKERGAEEMLQLIATLKEKFGRECRLVLIGPMELSYRNFLKGYVTSLNLDSQVNLLDAMPLPEAWVYLERSKIGLSLLHGSPNLVHSIPTKLFDYYAVQIPVMVSDFPFWRQMVENDKSGIVVNPFNIDELAHEALKLLDNELLRQRYGQSGLEALKARYQWKHEEAQLHKMYTEILDLSLGSENHGYAAS